MIIKEIHAPLHQKGDVRRTPVCHFLQYFPSIGKFEFPHEE